MVLKPAELTPLTALRFAEHRASRRGCPDGVVNVVVGPGSACGQRLVEHPDVAKIAFTGSTEVGRSIAAGAARTIKRVTLELGGKSANVVFADADLEAAARRRRWPCSATPARTAARARGSSCEHSALERFLELLEAAVKALRVGDPLDEDTQMGPLISAGQRDDGGLVRARRTRRSRSAAARPTGPATGSRRPSCARSRPTTARRARRSSGRSRR